MMLLQSLRMTRMLAMTSKLFVYISSHYSNHYVSTRMLQMLFALKKCQITNISSADLDLQSHYEDSKCSPFLLYAFTTLFIVIILILCFRDIDVNTLYLNEFIFIFTYLNESIPHINNIGKWYVWVFQYIYYCIDIYDLVNS